MLKYVNTGVVFQEIPDEVTLSINLSNCPCHCPGCHSQYLWKDIGTPLSVSALSRMVHEYGHDITCICFMGGDAEPEYIDMLARYLHSEFPHLKTGWYSGRQRISPKIDKHNFDYIKVGPYIRHLGCLKDPTTNQRLYKRDRSGDFKDITMKFWRKTV
ncbi:anaerobic ribonucleoside-triphosphate reductase activating protein [Xylanibacter muris]|uniref:Anaerobic ribonucleoside-triphosphate reductase activating protein n=1 Tax=Xylanibacter muris TaxID=2736290 RepID=A0ABX2ANX8_9BACT|nr:anaerobic ribonucleoside-triphosphate reductase activating protein [Xylanibacter muris]NPD92653.1 anaerobic ribonucleoside-triphosphate reductase activating protein [Xylanibacter muris]